MLSIYIYLVFLLHQAQSRGVALKNGAQVHSYILLLSARENSSLTTLPL